MPRTTTDPETSTVTHAPERPVDRHRGERHEQGDPLARDARVLIVPRVVGFAIAGWTLSGPLPLDMHFHMLLAAAFAGMALVPVTIFASSRRTRQQAFHASMVVDAVVLLLLIHLTGGLQSPLLPLPLAWVTIGMLAYRGVAAIAYTTLLGLTVLLQHVIDRFYPHPPLGDAITLAEVTVLLVVAIAGSAEITTRFVDRRHRILHSQATRDPLTGTGNRRMLSQRLRSLIDSGTDFAVAAIDIDHFKRFNDEYGHASGDLVLQRFAERLDGATRSGDEVYRVGGEEFVVLLADTDVERACPVIRRAQEALRLEPLVEHLPTVTFSVGIADNTHDDPASLADELLYDAKNAGRDRIHCPRSRSDDVVRSRAGDLTATGST